MTLLSIAGIGAFLLACTIVGIRLLLLWWRTRELPELAVALAFLFGGALGYVPIVVATSVPSLPEPVSTTTLAAGILALDLGAGALWLFTWRVFRPADSRARLLFLGAITLMFCAFVGQVAAGGLSVTAHQHSGWYWAGFLARASAFAWGALESFLYFSVLRKRARLGLTGRSDANVFLLWGVATGAAFLIFTMTALGMLLNESQLPAPLLVAQSLVGLTAAGAIWLTFFPPAWYTQCLEHRAVPDESSRDA